MLKWILAGFVSGEYLLVIVYCNKVNKISAFKNSNCCFTLLFHLCMIIWFISCILWFVSCDLIRTDLRPCSLKQLLWCVSHLMNVAFVKPALCFSPSSCAAVTALKCQRTPEGPALLTQSSRSLCTHPVKSVHLLACSAFEGNWWFIYCVNDFWRIVWHWRLE